MDDLFVPREPLIQKLRWIIHFAVRLLAVLMTLVILWGVLDVAWVLYKRLMDPPFLMLTISDILDTFGAFMAVLIAIEIFVNISVYLRDDVIHVKIVMATALMAIARKVIILDYSKISPDYIWATAAVVLAMSIGYWLVIGVKEEDVGKTSLRTTESSIVESSAEPATGEKGPALQGMMKGSKGFLSEFRSCLLGSPEERDRSR